MTKHMIYEHLFTPDEARRIFDNTIESGYNFRTTDTKNRSVLHLANSMKAGEWRWQEANPIRLSEDWRTASDGIHRLLACSMSGIPLRSLVLVGEQWRAGINSDRGRSRTLAQYFTHSGIPNGTLKAAVVRTHVARLKAYAMNTTINYANAVAVHDGELIEFAEKNAVELDWISGRASIASSKGMNSTGYGVFLLEGHSIDPETAGDFHSTLSGDVVDNEGDPIINLRRFAVRRFDATGKRLQQDPTIRAMVKCWDLRERGEALRMWKQPTYDDVRFPSGFAPPAKTALPLKQKATSQ